MSQTLSQNRKIGMRKKPPIQPDIQPAMENQKNEDYLQFQQGINKNNMYTIHTSIWFICFQNKIWIVFTLLFFWFLLKLPIVDRELLSYIHLICQKSRYMDIWMCHRCCHKIGKFEIKESHSSNQIQSQTCKTRNLKNGVQFQQEMKKKII